MVSLCRELDLTLLCEGVETVAQKDMLRALGSNEAQGYLFGRPEPQRVFLERISDFQPSGGSNRIPRYQSSSTR